MSAPRPGEPGDLQWHRRRAIPHDEHPTEVFRFEVEDECPPEELHDEYGYESEFDGDEYDHFNEEFDEADPEVEYSEHEYSGRRGRRWEKRGRRALGWVAAIVVIVLLGGGAWYGVNAIFGYDDFVGNGELDVVVQVADGDSTNAIAAKLADAGVVASPKAFVKAGADNPQLSRVQPGYYVLKKRMSGASAVSKLIAPGSRVGQLQVRAGTQFDDITQPDGKVTEGVYTLLSKASCAQLNDKSTCIPVEELRKTVATADLATLGVPAWAVTAAQDSPKERRLEGLISPGVYDVKPGWTATELLSNAVKMSAQQLRTAGLTDQAGVEKQTPYRTLVIASIIEREAVEVDFGKISRVIYNRLAKNMRLEMDSTVNYLLDRPVLLTKPEDLTKAGPYNTYRTLGLPPTPISAPSKEAIQAALRPPEGEWFYFVKCETNGISCFAVTKAEHDKNKEDAHGRGIY